MSQTMATREEKVCARLIKQDTLFINPYIIEDFEQMKEVLGGESYAYLLPEDILLWYSKPSTFDEYGHTVTIQNGDNVDYLFGNVFITSNDDESINGIRSLSVHQMEWLRKNFFLAHSELHGNHVMKFIATTKPAIVR